MANKYLLKRSAVSGKVPLATDLEYGELAINYADEKLYFKNSANEIKEVVQSASIPSSIQYDANNSIEFDDSGLLPVINFKVDGNVVFSIAADKISSYLPLDMNSNQIDFVGSPTETDDAAILGTVETAEKYKLLPIGDYGSLTSSSDLDAFGVAITSGVISYDMMLPEGSVIQYNFEAL